MMRGIRKKTLCDITDFIIWNAIGLLPILYAIITCVIATNNSVVYRSFADSVLEFTSSITIESNTLYWVLHNIFGVSTFGINLNCEPLLKCIAFFGTVKLIHLVLDFILFIPTLITKFMSRLGG